MLWFRFTPGVHASTIREDESLVFVFCEGRLLIEDTGTGVTVPSMSRWQMLGGAETSRHYLGCLDNISCYAIETESRLELPEAFHFEDLRRFLLRGQESLFAVAGRASQVLTWHRDHRFCSRCGGAVQDHEKDRARYCPSCGYIQYPRINPCIICLVTRGEDLLLARGVRFSLPMYSTLAGFIEAGESVEEALHREIREEVGVEVKDLRYCTSQSWPFPHSLMLGFHAEYAQGALEIDPEEILDAQWFSPDALPDIPPRGSISRLLIDEHLQRVRGI